MQTIDRVTVLGTGVLGSQIIMQAAYHGKRVVAYDVSEAALAALPARWEWIAQGYRRDLPDFTEERFADALGRITTTTDLAGAVEQADLVIEAVPESLELKRRVWAAVGAAAPAHALFATNTSTLRPSDLMDATGRPEQFTTLHFSNHIWRLNTAEVMATPRTSTATMDAVLQYAEQTGMVGIRILRETPAYLLNSLLVPLMMAAQELYVSGAGSYEDIDRTWSIGTESPRGPFEIYDIIGFNVPYAILVNAATAAGGEPGPFARLLKDAIDAGHTGAASGEGFYRWDADGRLLGPGSVMPSVYPAQG